MTIINHALNALLLNNSSEMLRMIWSGDVCSDLGKTNSTADSGCGLRVRYLCRLGGPLRSQESLTPVE